MYLKLLQQYPEITRPEGIPTPAKHGTMHYIRTTPGQPVTCKPRQLPLDQLKAEKRVFRVMIKLRIATPSKSSWSSPLHVVQIKEAGE